MIELCLPPAPLSLTGPRGFPPGDHDVYDFLKAVIPRFPDCARRMIVQVRFVALLNACLEDLSRFLRDVDPDRRLPVADIHKAWGLAHAKRNAASAGSERTPFLSRVLRGSSGRGNDSDALRKRGREG